MRPLPHHLDHMPRSKLPSKIMSCSADTGQNIPKCPERIFAMKNHGAFCRLREKDQPVIFRLVIAVFKENIQVSCNIIPLETEIVETHSFTTDDKSKAAAYVAKFKSLIYEEKFDYLEYQEPDGATEEIYAKIGEWMKQ